MCRRESGVRFRAALKAFLPPARASQAGLKKISTFRFSSGSIFFAQPLHWEPRFVLSWQLKVPGAQAKALAPNRNHATAQFERTSKRLLGGSLVAHSGLPLGGVLSQFKRLVTLDKYSTIQCFVVQSPAASPLC